MELVAEDDTIKVRAKLYVNFIHGNVISSSFI
jgi:hypothetical protein